MTQPDPDSTPPAQAAYPVPPTWEAQRPASLPGYPAVGYGAPSQAWAEPPRAPRKPAPFALIAAALGLLALVFSFLPWISLRVELGSLDTLISDEDRSLLNSTLDDLYANAWDLRWATRSVLLAVLAALLLTGPLIDRRLRSPWMLAAAVAASAGATVLMAIQIVNRSGIYGRVLDVASNLANTDTAGTGTEGVRVGFALRCGAFATAAMILAQFAVLVVLWLQSRPSGDKSDALVPQAQPAPLGAI
ncbi:MAG: hypothetical protein JWN20_918 [Jatrophihabitantaceae bacterium]|nr:hypothetical protein [Jatrophihabitantaceae bacterium]